MKLWIRSQNKIILQKVNALFIAHGNDNVWAICDNQNLTKYGEYKSEERALEVLDEIQKLLKPQLIIKDSGKIIGTLENAIIKEGATYELKELSTYVYEMPKE